ncbi:hypothetical protein B0H13DRAFT_1931918 [Mycena leptocephala]|nr:hypothetical protein B0H13DRAFT_1931918 [Mycena leptocephala]
MIAFPRLRAARMPRSSPHRSLSPSLRPQKTTDGTAVSRMRTSCIFGNTPRSTNARSSSPPASSELSSRVRAPLCPRAILRRPCFVFGTARAAAIMYWARGGGENDRCADRPPAWFSLRWSNSHIKELRTRVPATSISVLAERCAWIHILELTFHAINDNEDEEKLQLNAQAIHHHLWKEVETLVPDPNDIRNEECFCHGYHQCLKGLMD